MKPNLLILFFLLISYFGSDELLVTHAPKKLDSTSTSTPPLNTHHFPKNMIHHNLKKHSTACWHCIPFHSSKERKKMKNQMLKQVIGVPIKATSYGVGRRTSRQYLPDVAGQYHISQQGSTKSKGNFVLKRMNLLGKKADTFAHGVREHVRLGTKISETVKGKLSLGARILQVGGLEKIFKQLFSFREGEKLLKACQCYLSTTAGPIAGLLFISSEKVAFCSERSIKVPCANGEYVRVHYKVVVPVEKIKGVNQSENMKKPWQKYMEIVTVDGFDIWFMGFLYYHKAFKCLQQAISQRLEDVDTFKVA